MQSTMLLLEFTVSKKLEKFKATTQNFFDSTVNTLEVASYSASIFLGSVFVENCSELLVASSIFLQLFL